MNSITIKQFEKTIPLSWSKETCYEPWQEKWVKENPALGQCYVTSRLFQDFFGGELVKAKDGSGISHYWNVLDGKEFDFTKVQYKEDEVFTQREFVTKTEDDKRIKILKVNFLKKLLENEGFPIVYEWIDKPNTEYTEHSHKGKVSFYVMKGAVTFLTGITRTVKAGERFDVPVGITHTAKVSNDGCEYIVGQEIEGDA